MFGRIGLAELMILPVLIGAMIGPARLGMLLAYAAGLTTGAP